MRLILFRSFFPCSLMLVCSFSFALAAETVRPNVLIIVSDDHGYADVGFHGCTDIPTPHLDQLAKGGLICTNGYVSHPFCSPTRAGLMTGRYQQRFGHENNPFYDPTDEHEGLPLSEKLLPAFLTTAGYKTGWIGKWHLGATPDFHPLQRGFQETFGFLGGGHHYLNWEVKNGVEYNIPIERNGQKLEVTEHLTAAFGHEAAAFVQRNKTQPWMLYLAFNAPHTPHQPTAERLERFASIADKTRRAYAAQVSLLDDAIGETLQALRTSGQFDQTLIFFFSDNGGPITKNGSINDPLRDGKGSVFDGGIRIPFVVSWPAKLPHGTTYTHPVISLDVFATALTAAGVAMPTDRIYDSVNLIPFLSGENINPPHDYLFWRTTKHLWAVRDNDYKIVRREGSPDALYKISSDIGETTDVTSQQIERNKTLNDMLASWNKQLIAPIFPGASKKDKEKKK